jgi:hypothetical protein
MAWCHPGERRVTLKVGPLSRHLLRITTDRAAALAKTAVVLVESIDEFSPHLRLAARREVNREGRESYIAEVDAPPGAVRTLKVMAPGHADAIVRVDLGEGAAGSTPVVLAAEQTDLTAIVIVLDGAKDVEHVVGRYELAGSRREAHGEVRGGRAVLLVPDGATLLSIYPVGGRPGLLELELASPVAVGRTPRDLRVAFTQGGWLALTLHSDVGGFTVRAADGVSRTVEIMRGGPTDGLVWRSGPLPVGQHAVTLHWADGGRTVQTVTVRAGEVTHMGATR